VQNPWTRIISLETDSNIVAGVPSADNISPHGIFVVVRANPSASYDAEVMLRQKPSIKIEALEGWMTHSVKVDGMLW